MTNTYVEFYFPGISSAGMNEKEVSSREIGAIGKVPIYANSCRFFEKDENGKKINFSNFYFFGEEFSSEEFIKKFPQLVGTMFQGKTFDRIARTRNDSFFIMSNGDIVT